MEFLRYWGVVLLTAWKRAWTVIVRKSVGDVVRDAVVAILAIGSAIYLRGLLVKVHALPSDSSLIADWIVTVLIGLLVIAGLLLSLFTVEAIFVTPYILWRDAMASAPTGKEHEPDSPTDHVSLGEAWAKVEPIRLYDAASLWVGEDPSILFGHVLVGPAAATLRRLEQAHIDGLITAKKGWAIDEIDLGLRSTPRFEDKVSRTDLIALAKHWDETPEFLFPQG